MITIEQLVPLLRPGWVAMDTSDKWYWYEDRPYYGYADWQYTGRGECMELNILFEIAVYPGDWRESLIEIKGEENERSDFRYKGLYERHTP